MNEERGNRHMLLNCIFYCICLCFLLIFDKQVYNNVNKFDINYLSSQKSSLDRGKESTDVCKKPQYRSVYLNTKKLGMIKHLHWSYFLFYILHTNCNYSTYIQIWLFRGSASKLIIMHESEYRIFTSHEKIVHKSDWPNAKSAER